MPERLAIEPRSETVRELSFTGCTTFEQALARAAHDRETRNFRLVRSDGRVMMVGIGHREGDSFVVDRVTAERCGNCGWSTEAHHPDCQRRLP